MDASSDIIYTTVMLKNVIVALFTLILAVGSGFATYMYFSSTTPQKTNTDTVTTNQPQTPKTPEIQEESDPAHGGEDEAVKTNMANISAQLETYASNNRGSYPTTATEIEMFDKEYISDVVNPFTKKAYTLGQGSSSEKTQLSYHLSRSCSIDGVTDQANENPRRYALSTTLPSGKTYCLDNA